MAGVYWVGQDGNTYMKGDGLDGVVKWVAPLKSPQQFGFTEIADPVNPPASNAPTGSGGGSGYSAPAPVLNQGAINNTQATIDQIPGLLQAALAAEGQRYQNAISGFGAQEKQQRDTYDTSTVTNQQNYDANFMDSIRAGIKGLGGLFNILRGTGAGGGTIEDDARDTVGEVTARDIRTGADTQKENQMALDSSLSTFLTDLGIKRKQNEDTRINNERAIRRDSDTQLQDLYSKMAGYYSDGGRTADANSWLARAGGLTPNIAANSATQVSAYDSTPVAVKAPQLTAFAAPSQPDVVAAPANGQVGSGIFTMGERRNKRETALAGA